MTMTQPIRIRQFGDEYNQEISKGTPITPHEADVALKKEGEGKFN